MRRMLFVYTIATFMLALLPVSGTARWSSDTKQRDKNSLPGLDRVLVLDGSNVHNVGELQMHVGNWGNFGSWPGTANTFSEAPSAQWPAGSGVEYLFTSGLWVGALKSGLPAVTTAAFQTEFRPTQEAVDIIYRTAEGAKNGNRLPSVDADDDKDGERDEDWLNGRDDDGDGLIDEDFAAVSKQMFSCWYTDDCSIVATPCQIFPQHNPLNLIVRQESYQWEEDRFDDFVGVEFKIINVGSDILEDVFIGFFADGDAGPRDRDKYWEDDVTGRTFVPYVCTDLGPVQIDVAYVHDDDGDEGKTEGYFGVMFLGHTVDPTGENAPPRVGISTYANFSGAAAFEDGGDPTNDFERYSILSQQSIERNATAPRDYRILVSAGPFAELLPDSTLIFQAAFAVGRGLGGMVANASNAQLTFNGAWFDLDFSPTTGIAGRETPVHGEATDVFVDSCASETPTPVPLVPRGTTLWVNGDCDRERLFKENCNLAEADSAKFRTGVDGKESQVFWIVGTAPPPPVVRIDDHANAGVVVYWDNFSETVPDVKTQVDDFEGYRVWRADDWTRPIGTSVENGPEAELWKLLFEADIVNSFGEDTGLEQYRYEPLMHTLAPRQKRDFINTTKAYLIEFPNAIEAPCPQGVTAEVCDTIRAMARWELGLAGGRQYYRYVDRSVHLGRPYFYSVTALDHAIDDAGRLAIGKAGDPASNFVFVTPKSVSQQDYAYQESEIYVVPNPATTESMAAWALQPNNDDPTGIKVEFRNLPRSQGTIRVFTLAGDLVKELPFDGRTGIGTVAWDLVSRNLQDITSGIYLYSVETDDTAFDRFIGKFVVIR